MLRLLDLLDPLSLGLDPLLLLVDLPHLRPADAHVEDQADYAQNREYQPRQGDK